MVAAHAAVLAGVPVRATLAEDDVPWDNELAGCLFGAKAFAGAFGLDGVGAAFGGVGCGAGRGEWEKERRARKLKARKEEGKGERAREGARKRAHCGGLVELNAIGTSLLM